MKIHKKLAERFAANLAAEQERRKLTDEGLAKILGVSRVYVGYLTSAQRTPSLEMVETIAAKLGKSNAIDMLR